MNVVGYNSSSHVLNACSVVPSTLHVLTSHITHAALVPLASLLRSGQPSTFIAWGTKLNYHLWVYFLFFFSPSLSGGVRNWDIKTRKQDIQTA